MATEAVAVMGHNNPPEPSAIEAAHALLADLELEAANWFDGAEVENQGQADEVSRIIDAARKAGSKFEADRKAEKQPHLDAGRAVDEAWKPLTAGAERVAKIGKAALTPFLVEQDRIKREAEAEARRKADEAAAEARAAAQAAETTFAGAIARDEAIERAEAAQAEAAALARQKANAKGAGMARAVSLRSTWRGEIADRKALLTHVAVTRPEELTAFLQAWMEQAIRGGARALPGVKIWEEREAA